MALHNPLPPLIASPFTVTPAAISHACLLRFRSLSKPRQDTSRAGKGTSIEGTLEAAFVMVVEEEQEENEDPVAVMVVVMVE